jgi:hypothetical protein
VVLRTLEEIIPQEEEEEEEATWFTPFLIAPSIL